MAGNIGAGKSTLTQILADTFGWAPFFESVDDNPYLADFYGDMRRWSFNLQVFFLSSRFTHQKAIEALGAPVVQDRSIYEDVEIFARNLHEMNLMDGRDYDNYVDLFAIMTGYLRPPDLLVYLRASRPDARAPHPEPRPRVRVQHPPGLPRSASTASTRTGSSATRTPR